MRTYTPLHDDLSLNNEWFESRDFKLGVDFFYNAIRDGSGRFYGYIVPIGEYPNIETHSIRTVEQAEVVVKLMKENSDGKAV